MSAPTGHLRLQERKRGPVWLARIRTADGRQRQRAIGPAWTRRGRAPAGMLTRRDAEGALATMIDTIGNGEREGMTFATAANAWLRTRRGLEASSLRDYESTVGTALIPELGERELDSITTVELEALKHDWLDQGLAPRTVAKRLGVLSSIFKTAVLAGKLDRNPCDPQRVRRPQVRRRLDYATLDGHDVRHLASYALNEQDGALFIVAGFSGLRMGELLALEWRDVDFAGQVLRVRRAWSEVSRTTKTPKSGKERAVPMSDDVIAALDRLSRRGHQTSDGDRVFVSTTGGVLRLERPAQALRSRSRARRPTCDAPS